MVLGRQMADCEPSQTKTTGLRDEVNVCQLCGALDNLSLCGGCRGTWYCCKAHQREDWKEHKRACKINKRNSAPKKPMIGYNSDEFCQEGQKSDCDTDSVVGATECSDPSLNVSLEDSTIPSPPSTVDDTNSQGTSGGGPQESVNLSTDHVQSDLDRVINSGAAGSCGHDSNSKSNKTQKSDVIIKGKSKTSKKKHEGSLVTISEEGPPLERYYLDFTTHKISFPPSARSSASSQPRTVPAMGQGDPESLSPLESKEQYLSILRSRFEELARYVVECLTRYGICVIDKFLGEATGREILNEVVQLHNAGVMRQGQLVHGPSSSSNKYIRGDMITWVDGTEPRSENIHFLISCMDAVMLQCASALDGYTINERTKAMVACYPGRKTRYVRHVDNPNGDGRCVTSIYYLNENWDVRKHGGMLKIFPEGSDRVAKIAPNFDRLIFFWSDRRNPHEVEQAFKERYAITVWYYDAEERAQALKKFKGSSKENNPKRQAVPLFSGGKELQ